jgi:hypothetical protein
MGSPSFTATHFTHRDIFGIFRFYVATEEAASVATEESSSVATEESSSVATECTPGGVP